MIIGVEINFSGHVHLFDVRREDKPVWTLSAHSDGVNGLVLSPQCPDCLITVSSDETMKVTDPASSQYPSNEIQFYKMTIIV